MQISFCSLARSGFLDVFSMRFLFLFSIFSLGVLAQQNYSQYVNVFLGTENGGQMFPGVVAGPFSPVKLGPDVAGGDAAKSGYLSNGNVFGYSLMHESGIGGAPKYGVVAQMPVVGSISNPLTDYSVTRSSPDVGNVGYYKSSLSNGVIVELAATDHVGFYQYSFPSGQAANVLVDASHFLPSNRNGNFAQRYSNGDFQVFSDGHYEGSGTYAGGWNLAPDWTIYFCGRFDGNPTLAKTFEGSNLTLSQFGKNSHVFGTDRVGGMFSFQKTQVTSKVGISWMSSKKACQFIDSEMPSGTTLSSLVKNSQSRWNNDVFAKVTTKETNSTRLSMLYSSLYGMHMLPSNRTGENPDPSWNAAEPYYDDIYTFWDLFRCTTSLLHILQPVAYEGLLRSIIEVWRTEGYLPDGRSSNYNGRTQGGSNADNVLADAYVKGVRGKINWADGYAAMVKDAEAVPPNNHDPSSLDSSTKEGRGALPDWLQLGYITTKFERSVSRAVEYSGNDFALSQVAKGLKRPADEINKYLARSRNWRNHWDATANSFNVSGFLVPINPNGSLIHQNPMDCGNCYWGAPYYEGKPWEYTVNVHHDVEYLIRLGGGPENFLTRLNTLMDPKNKIFDGGNEPDFGTPYLFNFINNQAQSVKWSRSVAATQYDAGSSGLPGNSDAGSMQSWLLWNMIGLYPLTGQTIFLIGSPWFQYLKIDLGNGKTLEISSTGGDDEESIYVQSLKVNGKAWNRNWLEWDDIFANGGNMEFVLGNATIQWDTGALPPSPASAGNATGSIVGIRVAGYLNDAVEHNMLKKIGIGVGVSCGVVLIGCCIAVWWLRKIEPLRRIWDPRRKARGDLERATPAEKNRALEGNSESNASDEGIHKDTTTITVTAASEKGGSDEVTELESSGKSAVEDDGVSQIEVSEQVDTATEKMPAKEHEEVGSKKKVDEIDE